MITFIIGLLVLLIGYIFYSKYVVNQFEPEEKLTPAIEKKDGVDFLPMDKRRNCLIQLLNIAGMGPILGAVQGILFGPIAFILIPVGCIFAGGVHDYFSGMISIRNGGMQITEMVKKYLGNKSYIAVMAMVSMGLLLLASVFVSTTGDLIAERFFNQNVFTLSNPIILILYAIIALYYILATIFPIDKIIGRIYPFLGLLLLLGTGLVFVGFFIKGIDLTELTRNTINLHPKNLPIIPMFFMTVSCGLLSGFHATQSTIISRTLSNEKDGKTVFYGMMCLECLIAMIWAAGAMHVYNHNLVPQNLIGTANVVNVIADNFVPVVLTFIVTTAVVTLPITSGDTALRALRMIVADALKLSQKPIKNRMIIIIPLSILMLSIVAWSKSSSDSFSCIWRYFTFFNQLITIPVFIFSTIFLYKKKKNYFITLIPVLFFIYVTMAFIFNAKIGFNLPVNISNIMGMVITILGLVWIYNLCKKA